MYRISFCLVLTLLLVVASCREPSVDCVLEIHNNGTVPYISIEEYAENPVGILVDSREREEYEVSHIKGAAWVGFEDFLLERIETISSKKDTTIIVYCSVGVRGHWRKTPSSRLYRREKSLRGYFRMEK